MGHHYVPQHYLRHFGTPEDPSNIWMYDKFEKESKRLPIKNVAQSSGFYSEEDERGLSNKIEAPAQSPLDKLRKGQQISVEGRGAVAVYLESMIKRVPHFRRRIIEEAPQAKDTLVATIRENPEKWASRANSSLEVLLQATERWKQEFDSRSLSMKDDMIRRQWTSSAVIELIFSMTWRIIKADDSNRFLTSDNPVFFDRGLGLQHRLVEISFPLASNVALHGSWQGPQEGLLFVQARPILVKEINRRVASIAERFLFFHENARCVFVVASKRRPGWNQIPW